MSPGSGEKALTPLPPHIQASLNPGVLRTGSEASPVPCPFPSFQSVSLTPITSASHFCTDDNTHISVRSLSPFPESQTSNPVISWVPFLGCPLPSTGSYTGLSISPSLCPRLRNVMFSGALRRALSPTPLVSHCPQQFTHTYSGGR